MTDYDFKQLNDKEFEVLATDLVSKRDGVRYERFKAGKDAGVDGRYFRPDRQEVILQCKHWTTSPLERVVKHLKNPELPKLLKLKPIRYVLVLSHPLSRMDKTRITKIMEPFITTPSDILQIMVPELKFWTFGAQSATQQLLTFFQFHKSNRPLTGFGRIH